MYATAISVGVSHRRAAVLWCCPVPADAHMVTGFDGGAGGSSASTATQCLVVGASAILVVQDGRVRHAIAANGWARATCPASLQPALAPNPMVKLALSLDGCAITWVSSHAALVSLRGGQLYVLQQTLDQQWTLLPLGQALSGIGEIETLIALPSLAGGGTSASASGSVWDNVIGTISDNDGDDGASNKKKLGQEFSVGLLAGLIDECGD